MLNRMYVNIEGGQKCSMPRYYKNKIYDEVERKCVAFAYADKFKNNYVENQRDLAQSHIAQFKNMYRNAEKNRSL